MRCVFTNINGTVIWPFILFNILFQALSLVFCLDRSLLKELDTKICHNEPSCHLLDRKNLPANRLELPNRDCMCDENCSKYRDCCADSPYYKQSEQQIVTSDFYCRPSENVYIKLNCSKTWTDIVIDALCSASSAPLENDDVSLIQPVTSLSTNITYGNKYCAICNGENETDVQFWRLEPACGEIEADYNRRGWGSVVRDKRHLSRTRRNHSTVEVGSKFINALVRYMKRRRRKRDTANDFSQYVQVDFYKYARIAADIWKSAKYDATTKLFVAQYDDKDFVCRISIKLPKDLKARCRPCVSKVIEKCDDTEKWDENVRQYCANYTSIIYDARNKQAYRNKHCAKCNRIETVNLTGCPIMSRIQIS